MKVELLPQDRRKLAAFVKDWGIVQASREIGCNRGTVANALAGLPIQAGTVALIKNRLDGKGA